MKELRAVGRLKEVAAKKNTWKSMTPKSKKLIEGFVKRGVTSVGKVEAELMKVANEMTRLAKAVSQKYGDGAAILKAIKADLEDPWAWGFDNPDAEDPSDNGIVNGVLHLENVPNTSFEIQDMLKEEIREFLLKNVKTPELSDVVDTISDKL